MGAPDASIHSVKPEALSNRELRRGIMGIMTAQASLEMHNAVTEEMISVRCLWTARAARSAGISLR
jgi:hypothetical protein